MNVVSSFNINVDVPVQLRSKMPSMGTNYSVLINFDHAMCVVGYTQSYDGATYHWNYQNSYGIRESNVGLQFFDHHINCWKIFEEEIQEAYAQYLLEKEIK